MQTRKAPPNENEEDPNMWRQVQIEDVESTTNAIVNNEWDNAFTGNRTHLRIEGLGGFGLVYTRIFLKLASFRLRCCKSKTLAYLKSHWMMMNKQYLMNLFFY
jgi:hypothetical protein